jgi:TP901-1 family phage major tail protein
MAMNGTDILLLVNTGTDESPTYEAVASQRDTTVEEASETIDYSSKDGRAQRVGAGRYSSTISLDALYVPTDAGYQALRDANRAGTLIMVAKQVNDVVTETALAKIDSISEAFPDQAEATISISLTLDGEWIEAGS